VEATDLGIHLDTNYYYFPGAWAADNPGMFTGSGFPMRFAGLDGSAIDSYQAATQMTDESFQPYPATLDALLDGALGPQGYYGVFTANMHTDADQSSGADAIVGAAQARGVPVISARQLLTWLDGRNSSSFGSLAWAGNTLSFSLTAGAGSRGLQALVPTRSASGAQLSALTRNGTTVSFTTQTMKGVQYATFAAAGGAWQAVYGGAPPPVDTTPPTVTGRSPAAGATGVARATNVTATFSEPIDQATILFELRGAGGALVPVAAVTYDAPTRTATLNPMSDLAAGTAHSVTVNARDPAGNPMAAPASWSFTTASATSACPCSIWPGNPTPANPADSDTTAVELGLKFRPTVNGNITAVRFHKSSVNTGTHQGSLWSSTGTLLGRVTFTGETASGWQTAALTTPVAVTAGTTYVVSYFAPNGRYAGDSGFFASGVSNPPLEALASGASGGNGVYRYGAAPGFPTQTYQASNYWVDVVFTTN
jgi:hypothetical protein